MSSTPLQWPNRHADNYIVKNPNAPFPLEVFLSPHGIYSDELAQIAPPLTLFPDSLIPNALAAGPELVQRYSSMDSGIPVAELPKAVGCVGNQLDAEFPYENRTPIALPLLMLRNSDQEQELDPCALPITNWARHIHKLSNSRGYIPRSNDALYKKRPPLQKLRKRNEDKHKQKTPNPSATNPENSDDALESAEDPDNSEEPFESAEEFEQDELEPSPQPHLYPPNLELETDCDSLPVPQPPPSTILKNDKPFVPLRTKVREFQKKLFANSSNLEAEEYFAEPSFNKKPKNPKPPKLPKKLDYPRRAYEHNRRKLIPIPTLKEYKSPPEIRVMGTWNYLYNGTGAMAWSKDSHEPKTKNLFIGNGTKLRLVSLKPSQSKNSLLSYKIDSIWEESTPPPPHLPEPESHGFFTSQIYQIIPNQRRNLVAVRRGRSIDLYDTDGLPAILTSVPNICYGTKDYLGWDQKYRCCSKNPVFTSFDLCHWYPGQIATMDQNYIVQLVDFSKEKSLHQFHSTIPDYPTYRSASNRPFGEFPLIELNRSSGVSFTNGHPNVLYHWVDSCITLYDSRLGSKRIKTLELLNLRHSSSSISLSEQANFISSKHLVVDEFLSGFKQTESHPQQYWVTTNSSLWLMDIRVPYSPLLKISHLLRSPPAYLDSFSNTNDSNYEIVVCSSQKLNETFCTVIDRSHSPCLDRPGCTAEVPILTSLPKCLSNSREFWDHSIREGQAFSISKDWNNAKARCSAWTTGMALMKGTRMNRGDKPAPFVFFTGNGFGDVFCQEWDQTPISSDRKAEVGDERLSSVVNEWKKAMDTSLLKPKIPKPKEEVTIPAAFVDHSLLLESNAVSLIRSKKIRSTPFDPKTPHQRPFYRVSFGIIPVEREIQSLRQLNPNCPKAKQFLDVWNDEIGPGKAYANGGDSITVNLEPEENEISQAPETAENLPDLSLQHIEGIKIEPDDTSDIEIIDEPENTSDIEMMDEVADTITGDLVDIDKEDEEPEQEEDEDNFNFEELWKSCSQFN